jgi:hypothetical protein
LLHMHACVHTRPLPPFPPLHTHNHPDAKSTGSLLPFVVGKGRKRPIPGTTSGAEAGAATGGAAAKKKKKPAAAAAASHSSSTTTTKTLTQMYLDLGQKSHGKRTLCGACGMLYVNGEAEDERDHAAFCKSVDAGLAFPGWKAERCVAPSSFVCPCLVTCS